MTRKVLLMFEKAMNKENTLFLATTSLKKFWKQDQEICLLGEWCNTEESELYVLPYLWQNKNTVYEANIFLNEIYDQCMITMTTLLNCLHNVNKSQLYWEIIIGNWLLSFIHVLYDRYLNLKKCIERFPKFETIVLAPESYIIPLEYNDFVNKVLEDEYNLQIYSEIFEFLGYSFEAKKHNINQLNTYCNQRKKFKKFFFKFLNFFSYKPIVTLTSPYFSKSIKSYLKLLWESKGTIVFDEFDDSFSIYIKIDKEKRKIFHNLKFISTQNEFSKLVYCMLPQHIPILFIEGYLCFCKQALSRNTPITKIYSTATALQGNYLYKFWIAEHRGMINLVTIQHGGIYGVDKIIPIERYERRISNKFLTWGWKEDDITTPLTHEKISQKIFHTKNGYILFLQTNSPKYVLFLESLYNSSSVVLSYIPRAISFLRNLKNLNKLLYRGYPHNNNSFKIAEQITEKFKNMMIDDFSQNFHSRLQGARLYVCDHISTTCLETLAMNFPTVIFIDLNYHSFRNIELINYLVEAKILFYDELKAAEHINSIYEDIDTWWMSDNVQKARKEFCNIYARSSYNWAKEWSVFWTTLATECNGK